MRSRLLLAVLLWPSLLAAQEAGAPPIRLKGRVLDVEGRPVAGAAVAVAAPEAMTTAELLRDAALRTDAEGRFEVDFPRPGQPRQGEAPLLLLSAPGKAAMGRRPNLKTSPQRVKGEVRYEPETDLGDLVLLEGSRLFGRVRGRDGKPLAGVQVVARDDLENSRFLRGGRTDLFCRARTSQDGIFDLPCALGRGVALEFELEGYYTLVLRPVAASTPLEATLEPSGTIAGRVLDRAGKALADAAVTIQYETRGPVRPLRTGADGSFRTSLAQPSRWRAQASARVGDEVLTGKLEPMRGGRDNLEIVCRAPEQARTEDGGPLLVRAVARATGKPVATFRAVALWEEYANRNPNYLDYRLRQQWQNAVEAKDGTAEVQGPRTNEPRVGTVAVRAEGFAVAILREVEWKELGEGKTRDPVGLELVPESTLTGTVRDQKSGEPVAGAQVWARPKQDPSQGNYGEGPDAPAEAATTGADGSFRLDQLGEGDWQVHVRHPKRPRVPAADLTLAAAEQRQGFELKLPPGATVRGRLVGAEVARGWKVFLHPVPRFSPGGGYSGVRYFGGDYVPPNAVEVAADGSFAFDGVKLDNYLLVLMQPSPPRCGSNLFVPLEPFRVREEGLQRDFDLARDRPGAIAGRVSFPAAAVPFDRLVVVAQQVQEDENVFFSPFNVDYSGPRAFVEPGGDFQLAVGPGRYRLKLVDFATGICLHTTDAPVQVDPSERVPCQLEPRLVEMTLKLTKDPAAAEMAAVDRLELRIQPRVQQKAGGAVIVGGGNENYDVGVGLDLRPGQEEVRVVLPDCQAQCFVRSNVVALRVDNQRHNQPPLGRADFETSDVPEKNRIEVLIGAPPEIPPADDAGKDDADGTDIK